MVRAHLEEVYCSLLEMEEGAYAYLPELADDNDRVVLEAAPLHLLMRGIRRKYALPRLMAQVGSPSSLLVPRSEDLTWATPLQLSPEEYGMLRLLDGTRNVEDLVFSSGVEALSVYQVLFTMLLVGAADIRVRGIDGVMTPGNPRVDTIDRERIREKVEQARTQDYYQILGISRDANLYEVQQAWQQQLTDYAKNRFSVATCSTFGEQIDEIATILTDARDVLTDEDTRTMYTRHML